MATLAEAYEAAHEGAILVDRSDLGVLKFTGETRLDLLHRMSTQAVNDLESGEGVATVLTTDIGRMVDRLLLYNSSEAVYALTGENNAGAVARYLMGYVFFNDDFHVDDLSDETAIVGVYGAAAQEMLRPIFGDAVAIPLHHWRQLELDGLTVYLHRTDPIAGNGYFLMVDAAQQEEVWQKLKEAGFVAAAPDAFEYLRIESALPRFGHEIAQEYIPLEAILWDDVSFTKGCYVGQEIIARMESRGRLAKKLVRLQATEAVTPGDEIEADGRKAGTITSAAAGPNGFLALGYVKTKALADGAALAAGGVPLEAVASDTVAADAVAESVT